MLLLVDDWAWDPFHGRCPFTRAFASTDAVLTATPHQIHAQARPAQQPRPEVAILRPDAAPRPADVLGSAAPRRPLPMLPGSDLIYAFMSILR